MRSRWQPTPPRSAARASRSAQSDERQDLQVVKGEAPEPPGPAHRSRRQACFAARSRSPALAGDGGGRLVAELRVLSSSKSRRPGERRGRSRTSPLGTLVDVRPSRLGVLELRVTRPVTAICRPSMASTSPAARREENVSQNAGVVTTQPAGPRQVCLRPYRGTGGGRLGSPSPPSLSPASPASGCWLVVDRI